MTSAIPVEWRTFGGFGIRLVNESFGTAMGSDSHHNRAVRYDDARGEVCVFLGALFARDHFDPSFYSRWLLSLCRTTWGAHMSTS